MNIPEEATEKAIAGGWEHPSLRDSEWQYEQIALDPTFWQALGKSLGWGLELGDRDNNAWKYKALHFYELILQGQPTDDFWKELLN